MAPRPSCTHEGRWEVRLWIVCRSVVVDWRCRILAIFNQYARCVHFVHCTNTNYVVNNGVLTSICIECKYPFITRSVAIIGSGFAIRVCLIYVAHILIADRNL